MKLSFRGNKQYREQQPIHKMTVVNESNNTNVFVNGNTRADNKSIKIEPRQRKQIIFPGVTEVYFFSEQNVTVDISVITLKTINRITVGGTESIIDLCGISNCTLIRNIGGDDLYFCPNATITIAAETAYRLAQNEYMILDIPIYKMHLISSGSCFAEIYANKE